MTSFKQLTLKRRPDFHSTVYSFNGQSGLNGVTLHKKCSHWAECQEWQMWFKISSPAFITVNAFPMNFIWFHKFAFSLMGLHQWWIFALLLLLFFFVFLCALALAVNVSSAALGAACRRQPVHSSLSWRICSACSITGDNCIRAARTA